MIKSSWSLRALALAVGTAVAVGVPVSDAQPQASPRAPADPPASQRPRWDPGVSINLDEMISRSGTVAPAGADSTGIDLGPSGSYGDSAGGWTAIDVGLAGDSTGDERLELTGSGARGAAQELSHLGPITPDASRASSAAPVGRASTAAGGVARGAPTRSERSGEGRAVDLDRAAADAGLVLTALETGHTVQLVRSPVVRMGGADRQSWPSGTRRVGTVEMRGTDAVLASRPLSAGSRFASSRYIPGPGGSAGSRFASSQVSLR